MKPWYVLPVLGLVIAGMAAAACGTSIRSDRAEPTPTFTPTPEALTRPVATAWPTTTPTVEPPTPTPTGDASLVPGDPTMIMLISLGYLAAPDGVDTSLIRQMGRSGNTAFVPVLLDLLYFGYLLPVNALDEIRSALAQLTGEDLDDSGWSDWFVWLGQHSEVRAPPGYGRWKGQLFLIIDPRISAFFANGEKARIRLEEIVWGGVRKDGIPDLTDPPVIPADQATYLNPDDHVFGVSINGEHRAYPLRIMNAHEMANDIVGGEPIALAY